MRDVPFTTPVALSSPSNRAGATPTLHPVPRQTRQSRQLARVDRESRRCPWSSRSSARAGRNRARSGPSHAAALRSHSFTARRKVRAQIHGLAVDRSRFPHPRAPRRLALRPAGNLSSPDHAPPRIAMASLLAASRCLLDPFPLQETLALCSPSVSSERVSARPVRDEIDVTRLRRIEHTAAIDSRPGLQIGVFGKPSIDRCSIPSSASQRPRSP